MWGNVVPTEAMVTTIKKYGFKTVRFPVTWMNFMDESGKVKAEWMARVKEVVDWIIKAGLYCILNIHHDGVSGNWLSQGAHVKARYVTLWTQIGTEFKDYDDHLIFESMNEVEYKSGNSFDYNSLLTLTQAFVDTVRGLGGKNSDRLLLISGMNTNLENTCSPNYKMPTDKANKLAISIHYYLPPQFAVESDKNPWTWTDDQGVVHEITPLKYQSNHLSFCPQKRQ
jgi:endoglucanase